MSSIPRHCPVNQEEHSFEETPSPPSNAWHTSPAGKLELTQHGKWKFACVSVHFEWQQHHLHGHAMSERVQPKLASICPLRRNGSWRGPVAQPTCSVLLTPKPVVHQFSIFTVQSSPVWKEGRGGRMVLQRASAARQAAMVNSENQGKRFTAHSSHWCGINQQCLCTVWRSECASGISTVGTFLCAFC